MRTARLRRFGRLVNGGTPTPAPEHWGGDVKWATPVDLARVDGGVIDKTDRTLTRIGLTTGSTAVPGGSILVSTRAPIGYVAINAERMAFNQGCKAIVPKVGVDARYVRYVLQVAKPDLQAQGSGSTFLELSNDALMRTPVPDVTTGEQRRIADFLDERVARIDQIIAARREQVSQARRLLDATADRLIRNSGPDGRLSRSLQLGAVGVVVNPSSYFADEGVPFIHGFNVREGYLDLNHVKFMREADSVRLSRSRLRSGDVLVVRAGDPGRAAVVPPELEGGNCASVLLLRPGASLLPGWLVWYLNSPIGRWEVGRAQYGAAQGVINLSDVTAFRIPLPSFDEQQSRVSELERQNAVIRHFISDIQHANVLLHEYKQSLITAAVTGELDVTTALTKIPGE